MEKLVEGISSMVDKDKAVVRDVTLILIHRSYLPYSSS